MPSKYANVNMSLAYGQDVSAVRLCALVLSLVCLFLAVVATLRRIAPRRGTDVATDVATRKALRSSGN
jgi:hypothetical protein